MKKIVFLLLLVLALAGCQMYRTKDTVIENKSDYTATIHAKNFKENEKKILMYGFRINAGNSLVLPMYNHGGISLGIGRNYLNKITDTHYEILNAQPVDFTVYNKTDEFVVLLDQYSLFDIQVLLKKQDIKIQIYNPLNIQPRAFYGDSLSLKVNIRKDSLIITY